MKAKWKIIDIELTPEVATAIDAFVDEHPKYADILDERINDLLNFPELFWASAVLDKKSQDRAIFVTNHQQIDLAGTANKLTGKVIITYFAFHV